MRVAAKALIRLMMPISGERFVSRASRIPPIAARTAEMTQAARMARFVSIPEIRARSRLSERARIDLPRRDRKNSRYTAPTQRSVTRMMAICGIVR